MEELSFEVLGKLCGMLLDWRTCGERLTKEAQRLCAGRSLDSLLPLLRSAVKAPFE